LVYAYSARPDEFVSQMPRLPDFVFRASVEPETAGLGPAEADVDGAELVVVVLAGAGVLLLDALLQATAAIATVASVRPRPALCTEVLESMKILPWERGPTGPAYHAAPPLNTERVPERFETPRENIPPGVVCGMPVLRHSI
jgi:hypothetical protein